MLTRLKKGAMSASRFSTSWTMKTRLDARRMSTAALNHADSHIISAGHCLDLFQWNRIYNFILAVWSVCYNTQACLILSRYLLETMQSLLSVTINYVSIHNGLSSKIAFNDGLIFLANQIQKLYPLDYD